MSIVTAGREQAATHLFIDSCVINRVSETFDPVTGEVVEAETEQFAGGCRVRPLRGSDLEVAGQEMDVHMYRVLVPWDTDGILPGDVVTVSSTDGDLDGSTLVVEDVRASSTSVARRLICRLDIS